MACGWCTFHTSHCSHKANDADQEEGGDEATNVCKATWKKDRGVCLLNDGRFVAITPQLYDPKLQTSSSSSSSSYSYTYHSSDRSKVTCDHTHNFLELSKGMGLDRSLGENLGENPEKQPHLVGKTSLEKPSERVRNQDRPKTPSWLNNLKNNPSKVNEHL